MTLQRIAGLEHAVQGMGFWLRSCRSSIVFIIVTCVHLGQTSWLMLPCISTVMPAVTRQDHGASNFGRSFTLVYGQTHCTHDAVSLSEAARISSPSVPSNTILLCEGNQLF